MNYQELHKKLYDWALDHDAEIEECLFPIFEQMYEIAELKTGDIDPGTSFDFTFQVSKALADMFTGMAIFQGTLDEDELTEN